jgi:hypothetical protein
MDIFLQGLSVDIFHYDIMDVVFLTHIVHIDNIRMGKARCGLGFPFEAVYKLLVFHQLRPQDFHCHISFQEMAFGLVNHSHAASAYLFQ